MVKKSAATGNGGSGGKSVDWNQLAKLENKSRKQTEAIKTHIKTVKRSHRLFQNQDDSCQKTTILAARNTKQGILLPSQCLSDRDFSQLEDQINELTRRGVMPSCHQIEMYKKFKRTPEIEMSHILLKTHSEPLVKHFVQTKGVDYVIEIPNHHANILSFDPYIVSRTVAAELLLKNFKVDIVKKLNMISLRVSM
jgi:hypothetical protein